MERLVGPGEKQLVLLLGHNSLECRDVAVDPYVHVWDDVPR
jgi:hypothetical protein